ncbi:MAG TPA: hypothetical protein VES64_00200, partial [Allosphingosinicella sp.]|nr:hypothetical protein [Allosphingosinicella sp.]
MKSWPAKALLLAGAGALLAALPALGQNRDAPESLLPPGFGDPQTLPPPEEKAPAQPRPQPGAPPTAADPGLEGNLLDGVEEVAVDPRALARPTNYFTIPEGAERPVDLVGPLEPGNFGLGPAAFGRTPGPMLAGLMRR